MLALAFMGICSTSLSTFKDYLNNGANTFRPRPFKLVLKLNLSCLNMTDERQIMALSNASNCNLENALTLHKTEDKLLVYLHIHLPLQKVTCCDITKTVYLGFYVAFNTVQVISRRVVGRAEETST